MSPTRFVLRIGPLGPPVVVTHSFTGHESLSANYTFEVTVTSPLPPAAFELAALGRPAMFAMRAGGEQRAIRGLVTGLRAEGQRALGTAAAGGAWHQYVVRISPRLALLELRRRSRIFRRQRVEEVIFDVLRERGIPAEFELEGERPVRDYITQYEESDYEFVRRLARENAMLFYFRQPILPLDQLFSVAEDALAGAGLGSDLTTALGLAAASFAESSLGPSERVVFTNRAAYARLGGFGWEGLAMTALEGAVEMLGGAHAEIGGLDLEADVPAPAISYQSGGSLTGQGREFISQFTPEQALRPTVAAFRDYDPARPRQPLEASARPDERLSLNVTDAPLAALQGLAGSVLDRVLEPSDLEVYEHGSPHLFPDWRFTETEARRILLAERRNRRTARGESNSVRLAPGHRFALEEHPDLEANGDYAIVSVQHHGSQAFGGAAEPAIDYRARFECVPAAVPYVPERAARRVVQSCLTATVVGPPNEEIHTNERGEIKVLFHWDREGEGEDTSAWLRVLTPWAGTGWGTQMLPRIGMEVVVAFESGDPDKPIVLGSVYNGVHPTPFTLPRDKTISGIRTRSTPKSDGYNELSFQDAAGEERIYVRAERDYDTVVRRDRTAVIHANESVEVNGDAKLDVRGNDYVSVGRRRESEIQGDDALLVRGSRTTRVQANLNETVSGDRLGRVDGASRVQIAGQSRSVTESDSIHEVHGAAALLVGHSEKKRSLAAVVEGDAQLSASEVIDLVSHKEIVLRVGSSSIRITDCEIEIGAPKVTVRGKDARLLLKDGEAKLKAKSLGQIVSEDKLVLCSSGASLLLGNDAQLGGNAIKLTSGTSTVDTIHATEPRPTKIELKDDQGRPIPNQPFRIELDDGTVYAGFVDQHGKAEVDLEGSGTIRFPNLASAERA
ncbi:MAG: type VI secretion system tip protein TssI/VgrG [Polyangiaceae bacterium]